MACANAASEATNFGLQSVQAGVDSGALNVGDVGSSLAGVGLESLANVGSAVGNAAKTATNFTGSNPTSLAPFATSSFPGQGGGFTLPTPAGLSGGGGTSAAALSGFGTGGGAPIDLTSVAPQGDLTTGVQPPGVLDPNNFNVGPGQVGTPSGSPTGPTNGNSILNAIHNPTGSNILESLGKNSNALLGVGGLGLSALLGTQQPKGLNAIEAQATELGVQGKQLQQALNGKLPPGAQAAIDQATTSAKAAIKSNYARMGLAGSTMETDALNQVDQQAAMQTFQIADQLLTQGIQESGIAANLYAEIMKSVGGQDQALMGAIANFAGGLAGNGQRQNNNA